jgi:hypothetical protein
MERPKVGSSQLIGPFNIHAVVWSTTLSARIAFSAKHGSLSELQFLRLRASRKPFSLVATHGLADE